MANIPRREAGWSRHRLALLAGVCVLAYAVFIQVYFGWSVVLANWASIGAPTILASILALIATQFIRTNRMASYFPDLPQGSFLQLYRLTQIHNLLNIMLPFRSGEVSFPVLMRAEFGLPVMRGASALVVLRLLDLHALTLAAGLALVARAGFSLLAWAFWTVFLLLPLLFFPVSRRLVGWLQCRAPKRLADKLDQMADGLPPHLPAFLLAWALTVLNWLIKVAALGLSLSMMGVSPLAAAFGGAVGGELSSVLPLHAPAGVGTYPAGIAAGAMAFGAARSGSGFSELLQASVNGHLLIVVSALAATALALPLSSRKKSAER
ncbi:hypothetical protein M2360_000624 [Rhizobium sp. SG_E_25_P2]|uniref:lysylphosphatidylglycerol synthase domain-containing protein n=1 Tax=Rhizobium sp. SG_E_25_P2 TaxID=2879942 RepID=UPI00247518DB|nr:lysylphosphatidylglycerol synthase domain-containing protein [Rhizobium sp. SG_E_25_P2]MDH6265243.1 hypothetical protein [Rhizobium sp. SG_E_25_P2]